MKSPAGSGKKGVPITTAAPATTACCTTTSTSNKKVYVLKSEVSPAVLTALRALWNRHLSIGGAGYQQYMDEHYGQHGQGRQL